MVWLCRGPVTKRHTWPASSSMTKPPRVATCDRYPAAWRLRSSPGRSLDVVGCCGWAHDLGGGADCGEPANWVLLVLPTMYQETRYASIKASAFRGGAREGGTTRSVWACRIQYYCRALQRP